MKSYLALTLVLGCLLEPITATISLRRLLRPGVAECLAYHSVELDDLLALNDRPIIAIDLHVKCAVKCFLKNAGIVDDQGDLQLAEIMDIFNDTIIKNFLFHHLSECQNLDGESTCETGLLTLLCIRKHLFS
ncbi:hypothetical protein ACLKA7_013967 [Drosophila subpalustris]